MGFKKLTIRSYHGESDRDRVEELERRCELVGPAERVLLFIDTLGDPICRIRNSPIYNMLVAELDNELVGVIQGSIKVVTVLLHAKYPARVGYILGLRVAPPFRRKGIGSSLVGHLEQWFITHDVDYAYMATEKNNEASVKLFTNELGYIKFRTPSILVNPVKHRRPCHISSGIEIIRLKVEEAEALYRKYMASAEFFPHDIDYIVRHKLSLGTWVAYYKGDSWPHDHLGLDHDPKSWAVVSVWNSGQVFKLRLGKAPLSCLLYTESSKLIDKIFPCFKIPSIPDFYDPFGFYFIYGVHREGPFSGKLVRALCQHVHNMAASKSSSRDRTTKAVVTEIGGKDTLRDHIPHWKLLSCPEDLWCIKALKFNEGSGESSSSSGVSLNELTKTPQPGALFVDPRDV